jgi:hypothetical protein
LIQQLHSILIFFYGYLKLFSRLIGISAVSELKETAQRDAQSRDHETHKIHYADGRQERA